MVNRSACSPSAAFRHNARYLKQGDTIDARGTFLGSLRVAID